MEDGHVVPAREQLPNDERPDEARAAEDEDARHRTGAVVSARGRSGILGAGGGEHMPTWLLVLIIVLVVLALFGGFGYRRR
jgi:hypothetical protein